MDESGQSSSLFIPFSGGVSAGRHPLRLRGLRPLYLPVVPSRRPAAPLGARLPHPRPGGHERWLQAAGRRLREERQGASKRNVQVAFLSGFRVCVCVLFIIVLYYYDYYILLYCIVSYYVYDYIIIIINDVLW